MNAKNPIIKAILILAIASTSTIAPCQTDRDVYNSLKDERIDSIILQKTPAFANHSEYKGRLLDILYSKNFDAIVDMTKARGFKGIYYLNEYEGVDIKGNAAADSAIAGLFGKVAKELPRNRSKVDRKISESSFINDAMFFEEYAYSKKGTTYFIRFVFINSQMNGILVNIHSKY